MPPGFAHGFVVLSDNTQFLYKTTDFYAPSDEVCILWNDQDLNINWHYKGEPQLSEKDKKGISFKEYSLKI